MFLFYSLMSAMRSALDFYLSYLGPLPALALLSLSVFVLMWPLYTFGDRLLAREKKRKAQMQGELDSITELASGSRKYFYTQEIYRRYGYSPLYSLVGLFGLAVQLPFFLAAYHMLHHYQAFFGLAAGPFADLGKPDALLQFSGVTVNLMPLLMTLINLLSAYYYAPEEKKNIWLFPALFLVLLYSQPVALVFYWTMNNVFSLLKNGGKALLKTRAKGPKDQKSQREHKGLRLKSVKFPHTNALHLSLFLFVSFLVILYFVESDKDKQIPSLWINLALGLIFYLALYYTILVLRQKKSPRMWPQIMRLLQLLLLFSAFGLLLRLLLLGSSTGQSLEQLLLLRMQIQTLRPIALLLCLVTLLLACILLRIPLFACQKKGCFKRYLLSFAIILIAMFWVVPMRVIASDPSTFEGNSNFLLLAAMLLLFCLLPLAFMALLYLVLPKVLRYYSSYLAAVAAWFFSLNVLVFSGNYGPMEFTSFRNPLKVSPEAMAGSALLLGVLLLVIFTSYLIKHKRLQFFDQMLGLFLVLHLVSILFSGYKLSRYHSDVAVPQKIEATNSQIERVKLSAEGRNVIILMLDKFMGGLVPEILQAEPELARRLDGFVFYPNTVSQAQRTYGGFHPIVGGSEYTVDKMNANLRPLATDIIEAFTMMPKAFQEAYSGQAFASYFVNVEYVLAPRARGTMLQRLNEEQVQVLKTVRNYDLLPKPELARSGGKQLKWQNFLALLGLFQGFGPIFREQIYNHGRWMGMLGNSDTWASLAFWLPYVELLSLKGLFEPEDDLQGAYVLYHNHLPHNSGFVDAHSYFAKQENFYFPLPKIPLQLQEIDAQNGNQDLATLFLANYETLYVVADFLDELKEQGLYDNSLIYLSSDHGSVYFDPSFKVQGRKGHRGKSNWHSLYMRKDFAAHGPMRSSREFRTMADIPAEILPQFGVTKNPYSGKTLEAVRSEPIPLYSVEGIRRSEELVGNDRQYYIHDQYNLYGRNIFDDANWKAVP